MKSTIGDRIRAVLEKYPEVRRNRAKLRAVYYTTRDAEKGDIEWNTDHSNTDTALTWFQRDSEGYRVLPETFHMQSLSEYLYDPSKDPSWAKRLGDGIKLIFNDGKFTLAP